MTSSDTESAAEQAQPDAVSADQADEQAMAKPIKSHPVVLAAIALFVLCAAAAVWFGVAWLRASTDDALDVARARDDAVRAGEQAVISFLTMDYQAVDANLDRWGNATTGAMLDEFTTNRDRLRSVIVENQRVSTAVLYSTAVIDLNDTTGTATVISAAHQKVSDRGAAPPADQYLRIQAVLQRGEDGWKLAALTYIAPPPAG